MLSKGLKKVINLQPWVKIVALCLVFISVVYGAALYADKQVVDYLIEPPATSEGLGIGDANLPRAVVRYDTNHYISIIDNGYTEVTVAFFPMYPLIGKGLTALGLDTHFALITISIVFFIAATVVLYYWLDFELKKRGKKTKITAWFVLGLMAVFPTSFYLVIGYNESLFLFLLVSSLFAYRTGNYWLAGISIALLTATRVQGGALAVFFLADYLLSRQYKLQWKKLIPISMSVLGLAAYMIWQWSHFGTPFAFIEAQKYWGRLDGNIIENLIGSFRPVYLWFVPVLGLMLYAVYKKLGLSWLIFSLVFVLIPLSSGRFDSLNRYMITLPVLFLALGLWLETKPSYITTAFYISSAILLSMNVIFFFNNYWVG